MVQRMLLNEDEAKALELVNKLLENVGEGRRTYVKTESSIYQADVESATEEFDSELRFLSSKNEFTPCVEGGTGGPIPVCISSFADPHVKSLLDLGEAFWTRGLSRFLRIRRPRYQPLPLEAALGSLRSYAEKFEKWGLRYQERPLATALAAFKSNLIEFLAFRFKESRENGYPPKGLKFRVVTQRHGLRVHYSPSYFLYINNVFGGPTSPAHGRIHPGRYKFGAVGNGFPFTMDSADFDVPPLEEAHLEGI